MIRMFSKKRARDWPKESLVNPKSSESTDPAEESLKKTTNKSDADLQRSDPWNDTLTECKYIQELKHASEQVRRWKNQNGIRPATTCYSADREKDYLKTVDKFVAENLPALPAYSQLPTAECLNAMSLICSKVIGLVPLLEDSELLRYLLDSLSQHLFAMLHLLVDRSSTVTDSFFLLQWVKNKYFGQDRKRCRITQNDVVRVSDPLLLADWLEYSKHKLLRLIQDKISTTLRNILQHDNSTGSCDYRNEEVFIQVQIDVIQCLNAPIHASKAIGLTLKNAVQRLCCDELHCFIERYVNAQRADEANLLWHFKRLHTCRKLRFYAERIIDPTNDTDSLTVLMLDNMETRSLSGVRRCFENLARDCLKKYFNGDDDQLRNVIITVGKMLATIPDVEPEDETKQLIVGEAYHSVISAYLHCLMEKKYKHLEKRWIDVGQKIMWDAECFNGNLTEQNGSDDEQKMLLLKMGEILQCRTADTMKLLCSELYITFPKESERYVPSLLCWRGALTRQQIKEVIDVSRGIEDDVRYRDHVGLQQVLLPAFSAFTALFKV